ncbi:unnamed protein product [Cyprideis torosa]|uniref:Uncharacterized protein n=1 Tax=Cyprideis torosa TaxID=163714 RepID=A0A7R8WL63_9CRUS|nr:unnamed protein product [Cyprideis torosa]CAG0897838.1 unnamed protein product [Cyprideis torosa]
MRSVRLSSGLRQVQRLRPVPQTFSRCRCSSSLCMIPRSPSAFLSTGSARFLSQEAQEDAEEKQEKPPRKDDPYVDVLEAALEHVPEKGFTLEAIEAGAADLE